MFEPNYVHSFQLPHSSNTCYEYYISLSSSLEDKYMQMELHNSRSLRAGVSSAPGALGIGSIGQDLSATEQIVDPAQVIHKLRKQWWGGGCCCQWLLDKAA